jgi:hypothetical protein
MSWRAKKRQSAERLPRIRFLRIAETISSSVRSGCSVTMVSIHSACCSNGEVLPPRGFGPEMPSACQRCSHLTAELALISKCSAASRRDAPASTSPMTRTRTSLGYVPRMAHPPKGESMRIDSLPTEPLGIPRFTSGIPRFTSAGKRFSWSLPRPSVEPRLCCHSQD